MSIYLIINLSISEKQQPDVPPDLPLDREVRDRRPDRNPDLGLRPPGPIHRNANTPRFRGDPHPRPEGGRQVVQCDQIGRFIILWATFIWSGCTSRKGLGIFRPSGCSFYDAFSTVSANSFKESKTIIA